MDKEALLKIMAEAIEEPLSQDSPNKIAKAVFKELQAAPKFKEYLKLTLNADMIRFFDAQPEEQANIKGAFTRTAYLLSRIIAADPSIKSDNKNTKPSPQNLTKS